MKKLIFILISLFTVKTAFSQEKSRFIRQDKIWIDVGLGGAERAGLVVNTSLNYQRNHLIFTGQYLQTNEVAVSTLPVEDSKEFALMSGWANRYKYFSVVVQAGPSIQSGMKRGTFIRRVEGSSFVDIYEEDPYKNTLGLSTQIQAFINIKYIGLGGKFFSTINKEKSFWGVGLNIFMGKLR
jgi:hypothetical protein